MPRRSTICGSSSSGRPPELPSIVAGPCAAPGKVPAKDLGRTNTALYNRAINSLSMRNYNPGADGAMASGHDQFFATFNRFGAGGDGKLGAMLAVARDYAAGDTVGYVETSVNPTAMSELAWSFKDTPWTGDFAGALAAVKPRLPAMVAQASQEFDVAEADADRRQGCLAGSRAPAPARWCWATRVSRCAS